MLCVLPSGLLDWSKSVCHLRPLAVGKILTPAFYAFSSALSLFFRSLMLTPMNIENIRVRFEKGEQHQVLGDSGGGERWYGYGDKTG